MPLPALPIAPAAPALSPLARRALEAVRAAGAPVLFGALVARFGVRSLAQRRELRAALGELELEGLVRRTGEDLWAPWEATPGGGSCRI